MHSFAITVADLFEILDAGFAGAEHAGDPTVVWCHPTPLGVDAVVRDAQLCVGPPDDGAHEVGYCYATPMGAILAAARWIEDACRGTSGLDEALSHGPDTFPRCGEGR